MEAAIKRIGACEEAERKAFAEIEFLGLNSEGFGPLTRRQWLGLVEQVLGKYGVPFYHRHQLFQEEV